MPPLPHRSADGADRPAAAPASSIGAGRFAPSPTGDLHLGNLRTAILAWAWARLTGRRFVIRIEDIDPDRSGSDTAARQLADLAAVGLDWDGEPLVQTGRADAHEAALADLAARDLVFECYCTRRDIRDAASAPHVPPGHYPGTCLDLTDAERDAARARLADAGRSPALRLRAPAPEWTVVDELHGEWTGPVDHFVVRRADGVPAYNLAVVVDDAFQGVDQVVRGDDLLPQAPGQAALATLLGAPVPVYAHVPLAVSRSGARLAKRDGAVTLPQLGAAGAGAKEAVGLIGRSLGVEGAASAADIADSLGVEGLRTMSLAPWVVVRG
ncbi:tRNA glutamyl-Q(34) synthetase GluQRS [Actinomyces sp. B33]|uniref:tRNA glutamyl-Q(34) synthetase GluQRS n=1 Tax=Actinomyces sp. B33 TaxID=2942131 RepID=UPI00233F7F7D|nr:tRNA glutamyl-Q(34) synthetase GluQRS [Actinomyces sp. B33]MDC4233941.1 tRNA glutamyl-Q(34) synthetase GluQRS [Actinomyces sp. B33]